MVPTPPERDQASVSVARLLLRYLLPVTASGPLRLDPFVMLRGYKRYLARCGVMALLLYAAARFFEARGAELLHALAAVAIFPFGTVAVACVLVWRELGGRDVDL